eukprot:gene12442-15643_t
MAGHDLARLDLARLDLARLDLAKYRFLPRSAAPPSSSVGRVCLPHRFLKPRRRGALPFRPASPNPNPETLFQSATFVTASESIGLESSAFLPSSAHVL